MTFEWHKWMDDTLLKLESELDASKTETEILKNKLVIAEAALYDISVNIDDCKFYLHARTIANFALTDIGMLDRKDGEG